MEMAPYAFPTGWSPLSLPYDSGSYPKADAESRWSGGTFMDDVSDMSGGKADSTNGVIKICLLSIGAQARREE